MEAIVIFVIAGLALLAAFKGTPEAEQPLAKTEPMSSSWGVPITLILFAVLVVLLLGLTGNAIEGSAYAIVESSGENDLMNMFIFSALLGCIGGLMIVNGIARGLGVVLLLLGILGSVGITELVR